MILRNRFHFSLASKFIFGFTLLKFNFILLDLSQADVRLKLAEQDAFDLQRVGLSISTEKGPGAMIYKGLELEESQ